MLLQRLREYSDRLDLPPTLYNEAPVRYVVELDTDGWLLNRQPTDTADPSSPRTKRGQRRLVPQVQRASGIKSLLLADKADYALGYAGEDGKPERVAACHAAFLDLLGRCASQSGEPSVAAVQRFLNNEPLGQLDLGDAFDPGATVTFRVDGVFPIDLPSVQTFWAAENDPGARDAPVMQCLVCGEKRPVLDRLQGKIKGVPGWPDLRHVYHLRERRGVRVVRSPRVPNRANLRRLRRAVHEGCQRFAGRRAHVHQTRRRSLRLLDA